MNQISNDSQHKQISAPINLKVNKETYSGQRWLVEERDACGVGFIAHPSGKKSHEIMMKALPALTCLEHRGGCSADQDSGDGAGLMSQIPWKLLSENLELDPERCGVAMIFLPQTEEKAAQARQIIEKVITKEGLKVVGWRVVPVRPEVLGQQARANQPQIEQLIVVSETLQGDDLERSLYLIRRNIGCALEAEGFIWGIDAYICSFSSRTIVYKGMVRSAVLGEFYTDLQNPAYESAFAVYHRRFSTNTMPRWPLAQPMRLLGHNGEINTLLGNINWMKARESSLSSSTWGARLNELTPFVDAGSSDSANLDNVMELIVRSGRSPLETLMIMVPEAYRNQPDLVDYPEIVDFYEYYSGLQEAWDGPALLVFSDGKQVGAALDRNGLRPARYCITNNDLIIVASEAGVVEIPEAEIVEKGRLGPGQMIAVDLATNEILKNWEIKKRISSQHPYGEWLKQRKQITKQPFRTKTKLEAQTLLQLQTAYGYSLEDLDMVISSMANLGKEPTFCMGDDIPLAVLSQRPHLLYDYFKQRFAQVTNPPIDPLREGMVMSLNMLLGNRGNLLETTPENARLLKVESPVLNDEELQEIRYNSEFATETLSTLFAVADGPGGLQSAVNNLCQRAATAVRNGKEIIILSDKCDGGINAEFTYIPPLLAVGAVHHHLIKEQLRMKTSLVVKTAQCWSTHHFACLIGYGASAVHPYLALESVRAWWSTSTVQNQMERGKINKITIEEAQKHYCKAIEAGLLKILSKMGISLLSSYHGAQIFEAIGIGGDLLELGFRGTTSRIGGLTVAELAQEVISFHSRAFPELNIKKLENYGFVQYRPSGEYHMNSPEMAKALHKAVATFSNANGNGNGKHPETTEYDHYEVYKKSLQERPVTALRDLLDFNSYSPSIPLEEVEPAAEIMKRFCTGGMSLGSLSREAHETLAIAMNRIGGKSNSGEGGEDPTRFKIIDDVNGQGLSTLFPHLKGLRNGDTASSAIKQVASGRFGVTPEYLMSAKQIEIKIAQGAKPGEGGQLPGKKVSNYIATLRRSKPGVTLISPPPHHDIYSIEDLAQLIFDLHQVNPNAGVSVKLVAEIGIGTIAAGVAKANADVIQISGHDGGTGASPLSSIKHAGSPWELGLTEVHRVLMENQLRDRVTLRVDGGLKTGWDVIMAALMGAEEFGFGSIAMIAEGCVMARICHLNTCPVGVATQQEKLRKKFTGVPENVVNFFWFIAEEVRTILARLGYRSLSEILGRADLLKARDMLAASPEGKGVQLTKTAALNLDCLLKLPDTRTNRDWLNHETVHSNGLVLDDVLLGDREIETAIRNQGSVSKTIKIVNTDRTVGARLAGAIADLYGNTGFEGQINLMFNGSAGQSFGAFNLPGMTLTLRGEANDYVGKGMHGGEIIIKPPAKTGYDPATNVIIGNTCLYGATGGILFANGQAGERFAVRNSMGKAVIEGAGDHACEYMTGGVIVCLGKTGRNVGAGMTGGIAYFLDEDGDFPARVNNEIVSIQRVCTPEGEAQLQDLISLHVDRTGSEKAKIILASWSEYLPKFYQVVPPSEAETPQASVDAEEKVAVKV
ncbi:MAG: glutamate synthase subunit alpha [Okeania sp. SIO2G4]|uniref:glutamate synthase-related protein n=1 Tax=unclassified Okeania TaxID=2634635 RepID=UPI0013B9A6A5|nr:MULTISPECIES: glutamate synthase-related protein [unclassified Okeania]NEP72483.1 glutamate synthase subunit alpha [Okeania sp. SIO2G5]NEP93302.1 glutamate synthase subunit alpha [Okeania sp. SIO2F5]NEQ91410.1 glutamate synthase subunit alpha [Okeania sp. SIO2G4]